MGSNGIASTVNRTGIRFRLDEDWLLARGGDMGMKADDLVAPQIGDWFKYSITAEAREIPAQDRLSLRRHCPYGVSRPSS
jgi:hypothetical protein